MEKAPIFLTKISFTGDKDFNFSERDRKAIDCKNQHIEVNGFPSLGRDELHKRQLRYTAYL